MLFNHAILVAEGKYLYGEKTKYSFEKPRQKDFLNNSTKLPGFDKDTVLTQNLHYIVQGPYELNDDTDKKKIEKIEYCLYILHKIKYLKKNSIFECAYLVLESVDVPNKVWLMYEYGGHKTIMTLDSSSNSFSKTFNKRTTVQAVLCIILKNMMGLVADTSSILYYSSSSDRLILLGLDKDGKDDKLILPLKLQKSIEEHSQYCTEYLDLYRTRIYKALGSESSEAKLFDHYYDKYCLVLNLKPTSNPDFFGWPLKKNQRVMFHNSRYSNKLFPGTVIKDHNNKLHVLLDPICFAYIFRKIRPDESCRSTLYDEFEIEGQYVRPMKDEEQTLYINSIEEPEFNRTDSYIAYFQGDIVKVYNQEVNNEIDRLGNIEKIKNSELLSQNPVDIGLVIDDVKGNPYWKMIYLWKQRKIESVSCRYMYWVPNKRGRALHIPKIKELLDELAPRKILEPYLDHFSDLL